MDLEDTRKYFVEKHIVYVFEKEKEEKLNLQENLQKLRTLNAFKEFIFENLEFKFENNKPDNSFHITGEELIEKFNKWVIKKNNFDHGIKNFNLYLEFQDVKYLGPANENKWYGITFKN